ncbi:hypothetical protein BJ875DRAFT_439374 [Amylocarpus encephaloides]|uniref:Uncharacterized protein n=1 Tax=Amylocarpus encephaloides TaxID=45428 RepID=A0A9P8C781_9HELO|nr:hypothetical protein BJ875DRAFT_439374 [Amylocarpus encephaloides]
MPKSLHENIQKLALLDVSMMSRWRRTECGDFNDIGKGGLYYLLSFTNFHTYIEEMRSYFDEAISITSLSMGSIKNDLKLDGTAPEPVNWVRMFASAFSIESAVTYTNPPLAVGLPLFDGELYVRMKTMIEEISTRSRDPFDAIISAVFGKQGHRRDDIPINMGLGDMKNLAVQTSGCGYWLQSSFNIDK